jgi:hypothetical protein
MAVGRCHYGAETLPDVGNWIVNLFLIVEPSFLLTATNGIANY